MRRQVKQPGMKYRCGPDAGCLKSVLGRCTVCHEKDCQLSPLTRMCVVCTLGEANADRTEPFMLHTERCTRFGK